MMKYLLAAVVLFSSLFLSAQESPFVDGQALIQVFDNDDVTEITKDLSVWNGQFTGLRVEDELSNYARIWQLSFDHTVIGNYEMLNLLKSHNKVGIAQFNHYVDMRETTPDDPSFSQQWHHVNPGNDADIDSDLAWDITTGGTTALGDEIVVCVIEGGNLLHEDLQDNRWVNEAEIPDNGIDDDENGFIDDYDGWDVGSESDNGVFQGGHGTQVMGMIGAKGNNDLGVSGVNWDVKIMSVSGENIFNEASVIEAYNYPLVMRMMYNESGGTEGAFVVSTNASWGIDGGDPETIPLWCDFYTTLGENGILSCGATANNNVDIDVVGDIPTACSSEYLVSVTATNNNDQRTFSAYGATTVDLGSPGEAVWTTQGTNGYGSTSGTSFASPLTAGAIALLYAVPCPSFMALVQASPEIGSQMIRDALFEGVDPVAQLEGDCVTGGRLNVNNSMNILLNNCSTTDCLIPFAVSLDSDDGFNYTVSWSGLESMLLYNIRWRVVGTVDWTTVEDIDAMSYDLPEFEWCTEYEIQLQSQCEEEDSDWSISYIVSTDGCCENPLVEEITLEDYGETSAEFSWPAVLAAVTYNVQITVEGTSNTTTTEGLTTTSFEFTGLTPCTSYEVEIQVVCADETVDWTDSIVFTTLGCGACTDSEFCDSNGANNTEEWIGRVTVGTIDNETDADPEGYGDYTSISTVLGTNQTYSIDLVPEFDGFEFTEVWVVWIDYNQDGNFSNVSEVAFESVNASELAVSGDFTVPDNALFGSTRMRVSMKYVGGFGGENPLPCEVYDFGEVEDYCVEIEQGVGVAELDLSDQISVYPNPGSGLFTFNFGGLSTDGLILDVFDMKGRLVQSEIINAQITAVNLGSLSNGVYQYRVIIDQQSSALGRIQLIK